MCILNYLMNFFYILYINIIIIVIFLIIFITGIYKSVHYLCIYCYIIFYLCHFNIISNNSYNLFHLFEFIYCICKCIYLFTQEKRHKSCHWDGTLSKGTPFVSEECVSVLKRYILYLKCTYYYLNGTY